MLTRDFESGLFASAGPSSSCRLLSGLRARNVNATFEVGAVFDHDTRGLDVADYSRAGAQRNAVFGFHISAHGSEYDHFQGLVKMIAQVALDAGADVEKIKAAKVGDVTVEAAINDAIATIGENMTLRRAAT